MKVHIIGIGPGGEEYILPIARSKIEEADCLIGAKRLVTLFRNLGKEEVFIEGHFRTIAPYLKRYKDKKKIAVLVSGDPGMYSLLENISKVLKPEEYVVIPGISAVQLAFARIGEGWQDAKIISLHGRAADNLLREIKGSGKVFLFTDNVFPPNKIAKALLKAGLDNRRAVLLERLSYPDERIVDTNLEQLSRMKIFGLCAVIIEKREIEAPRAKTCGFSERNTERPCSIRGLKAAVLWPRMYKIAKGKLYGIGIGPGDPKLVTLKAKEILDSVDTVFVPKSSDDGTSCARSIVEAVTQTQKTFVELIFPMTKDKAILNKYWKKAANIIAKEINKGRVAAFVTIGDPFIYSTYIYLLKTMQQDFPNIKVETIPGISAFNAAAATADLALVEGNERMAIVPVTKDLKKVREALEEFDTVVLMKVGSKLNKVALLLKELGLARNAILISRIGHKDERIIHNLSLLRDKKIGYLSVIIVRRAKS